MAANELGQLGFTRIKRIFDAVQDVRQVPKNLTFRNRTGKVAATDADIIAKFLYQGHIADIVSDDAKASTYQAGRIKFEANMIPNIKLGRTLTQEDFKRLEFLAANPAGNVESDSYEAYFQREAEGLLQSIEWREEQMLVAMEIDSFTYNRNGVILNLSWGMPSEFKVTTSTAWSNAGSATPVADILNMCLVASSKYGKNFNRIKMSTSAFYLMIKTTEFTNAVKNIYINAGQPTPAIPYQSTDTMKTLAQTILNGKIIELYDARYPTQATADGSITYTPFLPLNKVIIDSTDNDNNARAKDFANGVVTESTVGGLADNNLSAKFRPSYGPFTYMTVPHDLNPPVCTWWAVERGMPRKYDEILNGVLDVGTVTDAISAGYAF